MSEDWSIEAGAHLLEDQFFLYQWFRDERRKITNSRKFIHAQRPLDHELLTEEIFKLLGDVRNPAEECPTPPPEMIAASGVVDWDEFRKQSRLCYIGISDENVLLVPHRRYQEKNRSLDKDRWFYRPAPETDWERFDLSTARKKLSRLILKALEEKCE